MMVFEVSASYLYRDNSHSGSSERSVHILFQAIDNADAIRCAIKWAAERGQSLNWGDPVAITICPYHIATQEVSGFIPTKRGWQFFEWKYDTSPWTIQQLTDRYKQQETSP